MSTDKKTLLLVDGSSYLYRAFHAMPDLRADPGNPQSPATGAIRGMVNMMQKLRKDVRADFAACVFDAKGPTFRDALYPDYKAQRSPMPDDLRSQVEPIHEVVRLLGWKVLDVPGVEADDVIGTLACMASQQGIEVIISSGDKDLSQLVDENITVIDTMNDRRRDLAGVESEFGVPPRLMVDYQTLVGDAVDNVPGVPKVGPKTAVKWLLEYGSLDALVARAGEIKGVVGDNLRQTLDWLPKGRELLTIKKDCELQDYIEGLPAMESIAVGAQQMEALKDFYDKYGFKGLVRSIDAQNAPAELPAGPDTHRQGRAAASSDEPGLFDEPDFLATPLAERATNLRYDTVLDWAMFETWLAKIEAAELVAVDTETTSLDEMLAQIVGLSFSVTPGEAAYIPLTHDYPDAPAQLSRDEVLARLKPWLENPAKAKLGQHIKYDRHVFANHGIEVQGYAHDTMLQSYVLEVHKPHGLASLAERHVGRSGINYEDLCGKGAHQIKFNQVDIAKAAEYSCEDSDQTLDVHRVLWPRLQADDKLRFIYELEMKSSEALYRIERNGVLIDAPMLATQSHELGQRILQLEAEAYEIAGQPFNLGSPKQLGEIFFDKLGMPVIKKTPSGARSTDEEVLEKLAEDYPLPAKLLEHRSLSKLKGTYTDKLAQLALPRTGRVHTHYAQAVAVTGRLSSNDPNLQNIPVRTPEGRRVREAFVAPPGCLIASADYSQIELRIMAHLSGDEALLRAFTDGLDVHRATAAEVFGVELDQVSSEQRRYAKVINFGLIYGMSSFGLARNLGIETKAAAAYIDKYFQRYPGVKRYMDETRVFAKKHGYVETVLGRRLQLPGIANEKGPRLAGLERQAINAPMQGTAADLIKLSMVKVQDVLDAEKRATKMIMQVHDELVFEVPEAEVEWVRHEIPRLMAGVADLKVPLLAEIGIGPNWEKAH
ncbi:MULTISPECIES: DNA polymerase I [unclassified Polaromonas]|jgi:DNA polymerase-1|uniref:DNA polymerase I n=1 Tax=unclassified Polaromonas TaxID=2638319 RepID=UPI000BDBEB30|nr:MULTISPECIES: DNA polymerase I [unclassified Polaromonas]OYY37880.1 MAG: DNA polymerase I [Polaromonas sp. 35-63-35]OYZ21061.1 MAG: DNA polymerase I [Polaromonas sp. 16-63-31]OYZ79429.1 MAG: DNA polymerase I [Polaromonas sp. 24-63-21]OZA50573.1 MAG: DNA polymerase I [Polaromonas sp. 17-63-33]OZA89434.1 MAG: DNA polymerase I [Polaromonas sp. 39-63-25]